LQGSSTEIDKDTIAYHFHEPLGAVGQIIPFNFPQLLAAWKIAPALATGNCTVVKSASPTPGSLPKPVEVISDVVPAGVINIVTGPGAEIGKTGAALAINPRITKTAFIRETTTGGMIMQYAAQNIMPSTTELGGQSLNIFFAGVMAEHDEFLDKVIEGLVLYAFNKGEASTCPSRALIQASIYKKLMARCLERIRANKQGNPLDVSTQIGPQVSMQQLEKISSYVDIGDQEGAQCLIGGRRSQMTGDLAGGCYFESTVLKGTNDMRVLEEEIFGPVLAETMCMDEADALRIANDTTYGLGSGVWSRDGNRAFRLVRASRPDGAGRTAITCTPRERRSVVTRFLELVVRTTR
jgi:aldehyde dehydrogenase